MNGLNQLNSWLYWDIVSEHVQDIKGEKFILR